MRNIKKDIEQLETAGELLDKDSPTAARLSLFLLDNLVELLMYRVVRQEFALDDTLSSVKPPKYSASKRRRVLTYFNDKANFLVSDLKRLDPHQSSILKLGHRLRNEAYHSGILRERIVIPLTRMYFRTVCELLPALWLGAVGWKRHSEVTDFLKKYKLDSQSMNEDTLGQICQIILKGRQCIVPRLSRVLADDLVSRIERTVKSLEHLPSLGQRHSPEENLRWIQFWEETDMELRTGASDEELRDFWEKVNMTLSAFRPKVALDTLHIWKNRARKIEFETSYGAACAKFDEIDQSFLRIESLVSEAIAEYEKYIDLQVDSLIEEEHHGTIGQ